MNKNEFHDGRMGSAISVRITPRSNKNEIVSIMDDGVVKIKLTAPPVDGKANDELVKYLAETLNVPKNRVEIVAGQSSRNKLITILDLSPSEVEAILSSELNKTEK